MSILLHLGQTYVEEHHKVQIEIRLVKIHKNEYLLSYLMHIKNNKNWVTSHAVAHAQFAYGFRWQVCACLLVPSWCMNPDDAAHILNRDKRMDWTTRLEKGLVEWNAAGLELCWNRRRTLQDEFTETSRELVMASSNNTYMCVYTSW